MSGADETRNTLARLREQKDRVLLEVVALCEGDRIRALYGGGSVFVASGLIAPRLGHAVSLVVDPASARHLRAQLVERGWQPVEPRRWSVLPSAVFEFSRPELVARIRLYSVIPGFFADPEETFDLLWERRQQVLVQGVSVPALDRVSTAVFATHDGLDGRQSPAHSHFEFFAQQFQQVLSPADRADLVDLVRRVGGVEEMRPLLERLGLPVPPYAAPSEGYAQWRLEVDTVSAQVRWALGVIEVPPARRREALGRSVDRSAPLSYRLRGIVQLPATIAVLLGSRRRWTDARR